MARRGNNIYRRADGRWEGRYYSKGTRKYRSVYGKTYTEAKEKLDRIRNEVLVPSKRCYLLFVDTADYFTTEISRMVQRLHKMGKTVNEIMAITGLKQASVYSYLPYKKGAYNLQEPTLYAEQTRLFRRRKKACESLAECIGFDDAEKQLWDAILAFENYPFRDENGIRFRYTVSDETILFNGKAFERNEIISVFHNIQKLKIEKRNVSKAEFEKYCDETKLYVIFTRLGVC